MRGRRKKVINNSCNGYKLKKHMEKFRNGLYKVKYFGHFFSTLIIAQSNKNIYLKICFYNSTDKKYKC